MRWTRFTIILLVITFLNASDLLDFISIGTLHIRPDLLLISLVFFATNCGMFEAIIASFAIGFAADISGAVMGPCMISFGIFGSLISLLRKVIIMKRMVHQCGAIFATGLLAGGLAHLLILLKTHELAPNVYAALAGTAVYSGIIGPFVWLGLSVLARRLGIYRYHVGRPSDR